MFSDTSSVTESSLADEDVIQRQSSVDISKLVVSDVHRSLAYSPTTFKSQSHTNVKDMRGEPTQQVQATIQEFRHETLHDHEHTRSESSPVTDVSTSTNHTTLFRTRCTNKRMKPKFQTRAQTDAILWSPDDQNSDYPTSTWRGIICNS